MKRLIVFAIAVLYFVVSSGMIVNLHYCMGKLRKAEIDLSSKKLCGCKKGMQKGCCKTEYKLIKLADTHKASSNNFVFSVPIFYINNAAYTASISLYSHQNNIPQNSHSPPKLSKQDTFLRNCVFRI